MANGGQGGDSRSQFWLDKIADRWEVDKSQFLLDFNIRDKVFLADSPPEPGETLLRVDEYLSRQLVEDGLFDLVLTYSLTTGIALVNPDAEKPTSVGLSGRQADVVHLYKRVSDTFSKDVLAQLAPPDQNTLRHDRDPMRAFLYLDRLLTRQFQLPQHYNVGSNKLESPRDLASESSDTSSESPRALRIALIIDYLENLTPASQVGHRDQVLLAEMLNRWANSAAIRRNGHLIVLLAEDINQVAPAVFAGSAGTVNIRLERPGLNDREAFLRWLAAGGLLQLEDTTEARRLAALTAGFNFAEIEELVTFARKHNDGKLAPELIRDRKRDVIRGESRDLLEFIETDVTFEHIGGLEHVKKALREVSGWLQDETTARLVPKGMLFVGPPGTGKSLLAQALANESRINMVKLRDVQSMWVGESERNMSRVLDVARAFAPVILFVDEIDQAYGQRSGGDSTGVSSRLFGKLLEFMGDNANRGKVVWVAASNRPDYVDAALISRFDRIVPFLLPDMDSRAEILLRAMPKIVQIDWADGTETNDWPTDAQADWETLLIETEEFSGRELELVARRGVELADGRALEPSSVLAAVRRFKHSHDRDVYRLQTLLALQITNFEDYLPRPDKLSPPDLFQEIVDTIDGQDVIDHEKVANMVVALRHKIR